MKLFKIGQAVNIHSIHTEKFKTTIVAVLIRNNLNREDVTFNALLSSVLKNGSKKYPNIREINKKTEELYGAIFDSVILKKGEEQIIQFYFEFLGGEKNENLLEESLQFLNEILMNPLVDENGFNEAIFNREKENLKQLIENRINDKREYAKQRCLEEMCKEEAFSIYGDGYIEDLEKINPKNLQEHYNKILKTAPIEIVLIGDVDESTIENKINTIFKFQRENVKEIKNTEVKYNKKEISYFEENDDIAQGKLCMGMRSDIDPASEQFFALLLANEIFGGGTNAKLFVNVREKESLCYYINSFIYRFKGIMFLQSGVDASNFDKAVELISKQLSDITNGDISKEELENAKKSLVKKYESIVDYPTSLMDFYIGQYIINDKNEVEDIIKIISNTTKEQVMESAKSLYIDAVYKLYKQA